MDYINSNKEAWEEAFDNRREGWGEDIIVRLKNEELPFLEDALAKELNNYDFSSKTIAQFCCNNGRELLSIMKLGASLGVGFDIAENMVSFANNTAKQLGVNCTFIATDILKIDEQFYDKFDYIFITVGAITWFKDLSFLFQKVSSCLKKGGSLIINEMHPVTNMLGMMGEENYDEKVPEKLVNSYFRSEPWIENSGMGYMTGKYYKSKTFYSYSHTFSAILNAISLSGMHVKKLTELDHDISTCFDNLSNKGIPLSYILVCQKN